MCKSLKYENCSHKTQFYTLINEIDNIYEKQLKTTKNLGKPMIVKLFEHLYGIIGAKQDDQ